MTTPYKPVSFTSESISQAKLQQMANNDQWLFENTPRLRYAVPALTRDKGVKIISGKTPFSKDLTKNWITPQVYFGSFFTAGCHPVVTATVETADGPTQRCHMTITGLTHGSVVDHTGFYACVNTEHGPTLPGGGFVHWTAVGY